MRTRIDTTGGFSFHLVLDWEGDSRFASQEAVCIAEKIKDEVISAALASDQKVIEARLAAEVAALLLIFFGARLGAKEVEE